MIRHFIRDRKYPGGEVSIAVRVNKDIKAKKEEPRCGLATPAKLFLSFILTQEGEKVKCIIAMFVNFAAPTLTRGNHVTARARQTPESEVVQMRKIAVINLKGGVGKTMTALSMAHEMAVRHKKHVLVCDLDPQANATKFFEKHNYDSLSMEDVFRNPEFDFKKCILSVTEHIDIVPSNLNLEDAVTELMLDKQQEQNTKLGRVLGLVDEAYDFCLMDCPPGIGLNVINALCAADDVIIPIKIDKHALDGMEELVEIVEEIKAFNPDMESVRCLITMYQRDPMVIGGHEAIKKSRYSCFRTVIRYSPKVVGSTFHREFIADYSCRCAAAIDYHRMVDEYMDMIGGERHA